MARGVGSNRCERCRRTFGGIRTFEKAHVGGACLPARELRRRGIVQRPEGTWVRADPNKEARQGRLFRLGRPPKGVRRVRARHGRTAAPEPTPGLFPMASDGRAA